MTKFHLTALIALTASLLANESQDAKVHPIRGVVLVGSQKDVKSGGLSGIEGVQAENLDIPGSLSELKDKLEPLFMDKPLSSGLLLDLKKQVVSYYREHHHPVLIVEVPEQDVTQGVIQLVVVESRLGEVVCRGNKHFTDGQLKRYIRMHPGDEISSRELLSSVSFMNQNQFRKTDVIFTPGKENNTTDIVLATKDRLPWRFYAGGDNTGTKFTGNARWFGGFSWGNVFGWDHTLSYQYTASTDLHKFQSHTFHYVAPTRYHHNVIAYGGFSWVHPNMSSLNGDVQPPGLLRGTGQSSQVSFRYEMPAGTTWNETMLQFVLGFDYKHMNNNLEYIGDSTIPIIFKSVNLTQFVGGVNYALDNGKNKLSFATEIYWSPGQLMGGGSNHSFNNLRDNAKNHYLYTRITLEEVYRMPKGWNFYCLFRGQGANRALLPSEQFGIGGYNTVRGYDEREFNADNAALGTIEIRCPSFSLFKWSGKKPSKDHLTFLIFGDYGQGWNYRSLSNERRTDWLASVGPGLRYTIGRYLTSRIDWGFKLHKDPAIGHHYGKVHVSVIASY
jgi:hemolysin activation/secretion protein